MSASPPPDTANRYEFSQRFPDEDSARIYFENKKWPNGRSCPHCGSTATAERKNSIPMPYRCKSCRKHFSVRTNSVLADSKLPLRTWLKAIYILTTARERITIARMARELGITRRSALSLAGRIHTGWGRKLSETPDKAPKIVHDAINL